MKNQSQFFGFSHANKSDEPAWFCTEAAAWRFAEACGWEDAEIETNDSPDQADIMDSPDKPWYASTSTVELTNDFHNKRTALRVPGVVRVGESVEISRHQFERAARQLCGVDGCACGTFTGGEGRCSGPDDQGKYWLELRGRNGKYGQEPAAKLDSIINANHDADVQNGLREADASDSDSFERRVLGVDEDNHMGGRYGAAGYSGCYD